MNDAEKFEILHDALSAYWLAGEIAHGGDYLAVDDLLDTLEERWELFSD